MTPREQDCLEAIIALSRNGLSPSYAEIQTAIGAASPSRVSFLVHNLRRQGLIDFSRRRRSIRLIADNPAYTPAALTRLPAESLRRLIATASGVLAHKDGGARTDQTLKRIGDRLVGRQRVRA
jgi:SOS-response transcriptional repressor LexA